jgi:hypothetical protein
VQSGEDLERVRGTPMAEAHVALLLTNQRR